MNEDRELNGPIAVLIKTDYGSGSGFFIEENLIVTNIHVVAKGTSVSAELVRTNAVYTVEGVAAFDAKNDLVILKTVNKGTPLPIGDNDAVRSGDIIQAIGYPRRKYKVTEGPVHSIRDSDKWIRMEFKTLGGNSGGPVLNKNSEVVGVTVANADYFSFAIPINVVKMLLTQTQKIEPLAQWREREQIRAYACLVQSKIKHEANNYGEAIVDLDKAIQLNPDYAYFYFNRGTVKSQLGKLKTDDGNLAEAQQHYCNAINDYMETIKLGPDYAEAYDSRGNAKCYLGQSKSEAGNVVEAQQDYQGAIDDYTQAIKICPNYAVAYNNRAYAKYLLGKSEPEMENVETTQRLYQEAMIDSNTSIKLASDFDGVYELYHTRGEIKTALSDFSGAIGDLKEAIRLKPDYAKACADLEFAKKALEQQEKAQVEG